MDVFLPAGCLMRVSQAEVRQQIIESVKSFYSCVASEELLDGMDPPSKPKPRTFHSDNPFPRLSLSEAPSCFSGGSFLTFVLLVFLNLSFLFLICGSDFLLCCLCILRFLSFLCRNITSLMTFYHQKLCLCRAPAHLSWLQAAAAGAQRPGSDVAPLHGRPGEPAWRKAAAPADPSSPLQLLRSITDCILTLLREQGRRSVVHVNLNSFIR